MPEFIFDWPEDLAFRVAHACLDSAEVFRDPQYLDSCPEGPRTKLLKAAGELVGVAKYIYDTLGVEHEIA